jgi:hypothetical protein
MIPLGQRDHPPKFWGARIVGTRHREGHCYRHELAIQQA